MSAIWMTPKADTSWDEYAKLAGALGWRMGEEFHPSDSGSAETCYIARDGTKIARLATSRSRRTSTCSRSTT